MSTWIFIRQVICYRSVNFHVIQIIFTHSTVQSPSWEATGLQLVKKFPAFHGTRRFITALTTVLSLSWASPIQSIYPHLTSWRSTLILSTHLLLGLPSGLFPSGFPTKALYFSPIRATCPAHLILLDFITRTILGENGWTYFHKLIQGFLGWMFVSTVRTNTILNYFLAIRKIHTIS